MRSNLAIGAKCLSVVVTSLALLTVARVANAASLDLSSFSPIQYDDIFNQPSNAVWTLSLDRTAVTQSRNNEPSIFLSDFTISNATVDADFRVSSVDDDFLGFVFGYQNTGDFYVFDWDAHWNRSMMQVSVINEGTADPFGIAPVRSAFNVLDSEPVPWVNETDYHFSLDFQPGFFDIEITQGDSLIRQFSIADSTFTSGKIGFLTWSLGSVTFSNVEVSENVPEPTVLSWFGLGLLLGARGFIRRKCSP